IKNANQIDNDLMGGRKKTNFEIKVSEALTKTLEKIASQDEKRANEVLSFYIDYKKSIDNIAPKLKKNKYACYVVGNRTVKGVQIPMDEITKDFFEVNGFSHKETIIRNIPNKRMPSKNSPTNLVGKKSTTMKQEYIVVMQKS
ncbi:MAG: DNA methyltransferase, partial [Bacteroidota bacterium]